MNPALYGLVELFLVFGVILGFGLWQLAELRKLGRRRRQDASNGEATRRRPPDI